MTPRLPRLLAIAGLATLLVACEPTPPRPTPEQVRAQLERLIPRSVADRKGWARDIEATFTALDLDPSKEHLCAVLAVTEQESTYVADPPVPNLGPIALKEIESRAARYHVPRFAVRAALQLESLDGQPYAERIRAARTERELSELFEEMTGRIPGGRRLLARANPVRTGGPMQVSIAFAEAHAREKPYPYADATSIRREVFSRRGGMYFGIAHLLDYPASYDKPMFRFADFNAGRYASRNAAFQNAVAVATGTPLDLDGDLVRHRGDRDTPGQTEAAVLAMASDLGMTADAVRDDLARAHLPAFERSTLYQRVFEVADRRNGTPLPRATLPRIRLESPKITRALTTEWFATRVNRRWKACMQRG